MINDIHDISRTKFLSSSGIQWLDGQGCTANVWLTTIFNDCFLDAEKNFDVPAQKILDSAPAPTLHHLNNVYNFVNKYYELE